MASAGDNRLAAARLMTVAAASRLSPATEGSQNSYTTSRDTTIVEQRHARKSILIASQIPVEKWPGVIGEPTIADSILDRIVHNAYRIDLKGESQRKRNKPPPLDGGNDK